MVGLRIQDVNCTSVLSSRNCMSMHKNPGKPSQPAEQQQEEDDASPAQTQLAVADIVNVGDFSGAAVRNVPCPAVGNIQNKSHQIVGWQKGRVGALAACVQKTRYPLILIQAQAANVTAYDAFTQYATGELVKSIGFKRFEVTNRNFGRLGDVLKAHRTTLPFAAQRFSKLEHGRC